MNPFTEPSPAEVPLTSAPLAGVVAQVRYPLIAKINEMAFISPFQEAIRSRYPVARPEAMAPGPIFFMGGAQQVGVPMGMPMQMTCWRFEDFDGWQVSLAPEFLSLSTKKYTSRKDFLERLSELATALEVHIKLSSIDRVGVRYIDRVVDAGPEDMASMIKSEVLGISGTDLAPFASQAMTEALFRVDDQQLLARWGHLPPYATVDPFLVDPLDKKSWILDLDAFIDGTRPFLADALMTQAKALTERAYAFFRWAVTDAFLKRFGAAK